MKCEEKNFVMFDYYFFPAEHDILKIRTLNNHDNHLAIISDCIVHTVYMLNKNTMIRAKKQTNQPKIDENEIKNGHRFDNGKRTKGEEKNERGRKKQICLTSK